jgi:tetratricopeptide (TPR) repeat protein
LTRWLGFPPWAWGLALAGGLGLLMLLRMFGPVDRVQLRAQAEAAEQAKDWATALRLWRRINDTPWATGMTHLGEGRACLALGLAADAERALRKSLAAMPGQADAWLLMLQIMRLEDRTVDAFDLGWRALAEVAPESHLALLRELTLLTLTEVPDDLARSTLKRWTEADSTDIDAEVAYLRRIGAEPRADDPSRQARLDRLIDLLTRHPDHEGVREALVTALADAGEPDRGRVFLEGWPAAMRDARYWRLRGRWNLEYDHRPDEAIPAFRAALEVLPHDWRTHYRLARALRVLNRAEEAQKEAVTVSRIRELLDPLTLSPKLDAAFAHLDEPSAFGTLADFCARVGHSRLADAWSAAALDLTKDHSPDRNDVWLHPEPRASSHKMP